MSTPIGPPPRPAQTSERSIPERMCGGPGTAETTSKVVGRRPPAPPPLSPPGTIVSGRGAGTARQIPSKVETHGGASHRPGQAVLAPSTQPAPHSPRVLSSPSVPRGLPATPHLSSDSPSPAHLLLLEDPTTDPQTPGQFPGFHGQAPEAVPRSWAWGCSEGSTPTPTLQGTGPHADLAAEPSEPGGPHSASLALTPFPAHLCFWKTELAPLQPCQLVAAHAAAQSTHFCSSKSVLTSELAPFQPASLRATLPAPSLTKGPLLGDLRHALSFLGLRFCGPVHMVARTQLGRDEPGVSPQLWLPWPSLAIPGPPWPSVALCGLPGPPALFGPPWPFLAPA